MKLAFYATIDIPLDHHKGFMEQYLRGPKKLLEQWMTDALSNIVTGPLVPLRDDHTGAIIGPTVEVTWIKENNTVLRME